MSISLNIFHTNFLPHFVLKLFLHIFLVATFLTGFKEENVPNIRYERVWKCKVLHTVRILFLQKRKTFTSFYRNIVSHSSITNILTNNNLNNFRKKIIILS